MGYRFEFAPEVVARANDRYEWMAERSPERAERWYRGLFAKIESLKTNPNRCPWPLKAKIMANVYAI